MLRQTPRRLRLVLALASASVLTAEIAPLASTGFPGEADPDRVREELFVQVFKHPPPKLPVSGYVMVIIDGAPPQKIPAVLPADGGAISLEGPLLVALLKQTLQPELIQRLERRIDTRGRLGRAELEAAGLAVTFDRRRFELSIDTPAEMRGTMVRELGAPPVNPFSVDAIRPATVSGFVNFNLKGSTFSDSASIRQTVTAFATDGALNVRGVVLEGSAYGQGGSWQRGNLRLVYDRPQRALRFTAGDLTNPVVGYQTTVNLLGLGVARDFALQPYLPTWRTNQFEFYLDRPAKVQVWANDSLVNTLQLPSGAHDLRGLNSTVGQNDVRLVIEDEAGRREVLDFSFIFNPILLEKGRWSYFLNAGFRRELDQGVYRYDLKQPVATGSWLTGWTDQTTLGAYTQLERTRSLLGLKALHAFALGTLQLDAAASRADIGPWDAGARLEWTGESTRRNNHTGLQSQVAVEYLGRRFGPDMALGPAVQSTLSVRATLMVTFRPDTIGRLSGSYVPARRALMPDAYLATASITRRWGRHVSGTVSLRHRRSDPDPAETELLFGLSVSFAKGKASFYAAKELESDTVTASWDSGRPDNGTTPYGFASTRVSSDQREYRAGAGYWSNQGLAEIEHVRGEVTPGTASFSREETTVRLQGALVFADGTFALARPVAENFAIVAGKEGLANVALKVDPDGQGGSRARSDWLGPAVLADLPSYRLRDVRVEPVDPPLGSTPDKTTFLLAPTSKSGFLLKLGREAHLVAIGRLVDEQRAPLVHLPIEIRRLDRPGEAPAATFTSRSGAFQVPDIKPGRYEILVPDSPRWGRVTVTIPVTADRLYRLGEVVLPPGT